MREPARSLGAPGRDPESRLHPPSVRGIVDCPQQRRTGAREPPVQPRRNVSAAIDDLLRVELADHRIRARKIARLG